MKKETNFKDWLTLALMSADLSGLQLATLSRPPFVGDKETPEDLNAMTLGQMVTLSECGDGREVFYVVCETLLGMSREETGEARAVDVVRFCGWVVGQIKKINALFDKAKGKPTEKELQAGVNKLQFGIFGLVDWYARRMGITDHEDVMRVPWGRVWQCLDMDTKTREYEKRYNDILADEIKRRR